MTRAMNTSRSLKTMAASSLLLVTLLVDWTASAQGYVTSPQALPPRRQLEWLKEMSIEMATAPELSSDQLKTAPQIIDALAHMQESNKENCVILESLVKRIIDEQRAGNHDVQDLTVEDYNCLLESWARSGEGDAAAERSEQILQAMQEHGLSPNLSSFKAVLMAWRHATDCSYAPFRAQRILEWMIQLYSTGENDYSFPDADCFDICLQTWSRSGHPEAPQRAEELLVTMERLYERSQSERIQPRVTSFNVVLAAWARSKGENAAERASDILGFMEKLPNVKPDAASYCTVLTALSRNHPNPEVAATKATVFLRHALEDAKTREPNLELDTILFNTAMGLWSHTNSPTAFQKAYVILQHQRELYNVYGHESCRPDVYGFTSVLACCASTPNNESFGAAWQVAEATYEMLREEDKPNHVSFATMLKATGRLLSHDRRARHAWARKVFGHAVAAGCVNEFVLKRLELAVTPKIYRELLEGHSADSLPPSWTANANQLTRTKTYRRRRRRRAEV